jgi:thiol-disulfide isomerase/thioredoxin
MDRLPLVIAIAALVASLGCEDKGAQPAAAPSSRVNAVKAEVGKQASPDDFCDVRYAADQAPAFSFPTLTAATPQVSGWRWVNVWATWCKPCVEEIPRLVGWRDRLGGMPLLLVSVDENDAIVADYRKANPAIPATSRLADPAALPAWMKTLGLDEAAPIPIHIFVDPSGRTRCVRAGGVSDPDLPAIQAVLATP